MEYGMIIDLEIYPETHCDECGEIVHNHIDCPVCNSKWAGTNAFCDLDDKSYPKEKIICGNCKSIFERVSDKWYSDCRVRLVR